MTDIKPGDTVDVTIKGVAFAYDHNNPHNPGCSSIHADDGRRYTMPPQAAITPAGQRAGDDDALLRSRIDNALRYIDGMSDDGTLDPWQVHWLRRTLDPYPRHWPPQPGDVWHDGLPDGFFATLWFAQVIHGTGDSWIVMVPVERHNGEPSCKTPEEWFADQSSQAVHLVYRQPNDTKPDTGMGELDTAEDYL